MCVLSLGFNLVVFAVIVVVVAVVDVVDSRWKTWHLIDFYLGLCSRMYEELQTVKIMGS